MPEPAAVLTRNWLRFGQILRGLGFDAGPARMLPFLRGLSLLDPGRPEDVRAAVRAHFARGRADLQLLDQVLHAFLRPQSALRASASTSHRQPGGSDAATAGRQLSVLDDAEAADEREELLGASYSAVERLRHQHFDQMSEDELAEVRRLIRQMRIPAGMRRTRRYRPGGDDRLDLRRLLRRSLRQDGEALVFSWRRPRFRPRRLVLLCDISGSMERYSRLLLNFAYAIEQGAGRVEAFVFATRLTRITRQLRLHDADAAVDRVVASVEDWSGGTRIGDAITEFNRRYGRRVLGQGATVVLISDGWDRGDPRELARAVAWLQRSCHRLIWMNPLVGDPGFEPLTQGLRAALPFVDDFLPAHNLASLAALGDLLLQVTGTRPQRGGRAHLRREPAYA
jgi:uncharacterized protein with von Willebrand factor type A (vWA) domain